MKILRNFIALVIILSAIFLSGFKLSKTLSGGIDFTVYEDHVAIRGYGGYLRNVYIPPTYNGLPVEYVTGRRDSWFIGSTSSAWFKGRNLERIYFPWCVRSLHDYSLDRTDHRTPNDPIILFTRYDDVITFKKKVVPLPTYEKYLETGRIGTHRITDTAEGAWTKPANVAFMFNYPDAPNLNYFLIDFIEVTGRIEKPPYHPDREGYYFSGWYKDAECTTPWNFNFDVVEISYDKNGERIYEEIRLYAKWNTKKAWEFWK